MCNRATKDFVARMLTSEDVAGRRVLEVGSYDHNGSPRALAMSLGPSRYIGVDLERGPGVDEVCDMTALVERFGPESFDVVITTEVLEHVEDWRRAVDNLKRVLAPEGVLILTTRSKGFGFHGYPYDFWRFGLDDMRVILMDLDIEVLETDAPDQPGVFVRARVPRSSRALPVPLDAYALHSVVLNRRALTIPPVAKVAVRLATPAWYTLKRTMPESAVRRLKQVSWRRNAAASAR
jgi:SAM-dependent methyltransferase